LAQSGCPRGGSAVGLGHGERRRAARGARRGGTRAHLPSLRLAEDSADGEREHATYGLAAEAAEGAPYRPKDTPRADLEGCDW
jgi:hypothetical protein